MKPIRHTTAQQKHEPEAVLSAARRVCARARVWTHCDRATWDVCVELLLAFFPKPTAELWRCPWEVSGLQSKLPENAILSQVWLPQPRVVLGEEAAQWCRHLVKINGPECCWRKGAKASPLADFF